MKTLKTIAWLIALYAAIATVGILVLTVFAGCVSQPVRGEKWKATLTLKVGNQPPREWAANGEVK